MVARLTYLSLARLAGACLRSDPPHPQDWLVPINPEARGFSCA